MSLHHELHVCERAGSDDSSTSKRPICHMVLTLPTGEPLQQCKIFLSQNGGVPECHDYKVFVMDNSFSSEKSNAGFEPLNVLSIIRFAEFLDKAIVMSAPDDIVYSVGSEPMDLRNAAFLLGSYMVLKMHLEPLEIEFRFQPIEEFFEDPYSCDSGIKMVDCWNALRRGMENGWFTVPKSTCGLWGRISKDDYAYYNNSFNGDLHEVIPGKVLAFKSPKDIGACRVYNDKGSGARHFSAAYYLEIFRVLGVTAVISLDHCDYNAAIFPEHGIDHHDLSSFGDNHLPSFSTMANFFTVIDAALNENANSNTAAAGASVAGPGLVAVHCGDGRGRTGTLIALYMMRSCGFRSQEAVAWLRMVRPGSVDTAQLAFLRGIEERVLRLQPAPGSPFDHRFDHRFDQHSSAHACASASALSSASTRPTARAASPVPPSPAAGRPIRSCLKKRSPSPEPGRAAAGGGGWGGGGGDWTGVSPAPAPQPPLPVCVAMQAAEAAAARMVMRRGSASRTGRAGVGSVSSMASSACSQRVYII